MRSVVISTGHQVCTISIDVRLETDLFCDVSLCVFLFISACSFTGYFIYSASLKIAVVVVIKFCVICF